MTARVLIHRPGSLGDTVVALPCFRLIRAAFPDAELRVLTNAPVARNAPPLFSVLDGSGLVDSYLEYPISVRNLRALWHLAGEIRRWRPDTMIYLARRERLGQVLRDAVFFRACGLRSIIGLPLTPDRLLSRVRPGGLREHEAERLARNLTPLGAIDLADPANWDLALTESDRALPRRLIAERVGAAPFIALSIGTKQAANDWGAANWRALVGDLVKTYPHRLVFTGADGDRAPTDAIIRDWPDRCVNLCGMKVRENAALIAEASLFIGHDSGPMHLAAAVGTPLVAVFSRLFQPGIWFPMGRNIETLYPYGPDATILSIQPAAVLAAAKSLLSPDGAVRKRAGET